MNDGIKPEIILIDRVPHSEWQFWEKHYISLYRSWGFKLTNLTDGGDGAAGCKKNPESIKKGLETKMSRPDWHEIKGKGSRVLQEKYGPDGMREIARRVHETRRNNGKPWHTEEIKNKISKANIGHSNGPLKEEHKKKISNGNKGKTKGRHYIITDLNTKEQIVVQSLKNVGKYFGFCVAEAYRIVSNRKVINNKVVFRCQ